MDGQAGNAPWYRAARVHIQAYDPSWPVRYAEEAELLTRTLRGAVVAVEHIGSTSVPGLAAKPVIDILAAVRDFDDFPTVADLLRGIGYTYTPESEADDASRRVFRKGPDDRTALRTHHLHVTEHRSHYWRRLVAFRDHLRAHPAEAAAYLRLKRDLADRHAADPGRYTRDKRDFVREVERKAGV
ncbi:GrpB family protein [Micromonospora sp. BL4]|uniref:GrpB family protein n=1 Tax=Micromonospora sp. BL4 TaxID=2478710 RepID=UPI001315A327|nr:GrpB family protein [Micromonospora sp. BL4]